MPPVRANAIICLTGSELTRGETRDLNGCYLGTQLTELGVRVDEIRVLPDDEILLAAAFRELIERADIVLVSGGLGPTADDQTVSALAKALDREVVRDAESCERMRQLILAYGRKESEIPANFYKQGEVVGGGYVVANPRGLAPGSLVETDRGFIVTMPGVPSELCAMFEAGVVPEIARRFDLEPPRIVRLKLMGQPESWAEERIQELGFDLERIEYGISAKRGELTLKFLAREREHDELLDEVVARVLETFGEDAVKLPPSANEHGMTGDDRAFTHVVHDLILEREMTVSTAESCTGGLIAKRLTDRAGSSSYFLGSIVAYQNEVKVAQLGVDAILLEEHGAVSETVCRQMASGAQELFGSDYAIAVTGIAGPGGATVEKPVGTVWIGLACPPAADAAKPPVIAEKREFRGGRDSIRMQTVQRALDLLRRELS